jgi:hypothetical protein
MMDDDEFEAAGGMIGKGNISTRRKPATVPLCPPQIPHYLIWLKPGPPYGGKLVTNCLSYSMAYALFWFFMILQM